MRKYRITIIISIMLLLFLNSTVVCAEFTPDSTKIKEAADPRSFSTTTGDEFSGRPIKYSATTDLVEVELLDGSKRKVPPSSLSQNDQKFIQQWLIGYSLFSDKSLQLRVRKKSTPDNRVSGNYTKLDAMFPNMRYQEEWASLEKGVPYEEVFYEFRLENKSDLTLNHIFVEYCIYYETEVEVETMKAVYTATGNPHKPRPTDYRIEYEPHWVGYDGYKKLREYKVLSVIQGSVCFENISKGSPLTQPSKTVNIVEKSEEMKNYYKENPELGDNGTRNKRKIEAKVLGIRYRIYVPNQDGDYVMIEESSPASLKSKTDWGTRLTRLKK